jgi:epoxyqueuosine reductase
MTSAELRQQIMDRAKAEGASLVGIVRIADLKDAPSYAAYDAYPFYPEYKGVEWKDEYTTMLVWALAHPASEPVLDWWSLKIPAFTPGNFELRAQSKRLRTWMTDELGMNAYSLPYQIEYGGAFLKDAAVLGGLGVFGRDNLLITREYGPRVRLRGIFMGADLEPTPQIEGFDPCATCSRPCHAVCPRTAFRGGSYERGLCKQEQDQLDVDFEVLDGAVMGIDEPGPVTKYCRQCELACPVGQDGGGGFVSPPERPLPDQPHFVLDDQGWAAFREQLSGKSEPIAALAAAAEAPSPFEGDQAALRLETLAADDDVAGFTCGDETLDAYLAQDALDDQDVGKTHVAARGVRVTGYFTLKAATVSPPATVEHRPGQPPLDIPVILLERLAVDTPDQGKGLGEAMLVKVLQRCLHASNTMFSRAVLVDAGDGPARGFFEKYGFAAAPSGPGHLLVRSKDLRKTLAPPKEE